MLPGAGGWACGPAGFESLHAEFADRLLPVLAELLKASAVAGQTRADIHAYDLMLAIGNLCIGAGTFPGYHAGRMIDLLLAGLAQGTLLREAASSE
jgi:hypothetical protein